MLRKRSRTVGSKQGLLSDTNGSVTQTDHKFTKPATSSFFNSPRLFTCFSPKGFSDSESMMSPTSILDSKTFSGFGNPFLNDHSSRSPDSVVEQRHPWEEMGSIGLGIVDALSHEKQLSKPERRMVLFGSHLKITIPPLQPSAIFQTPKTSDSQFGPSSPCSVKKTPLDSVSFSPVFTGCLSASEMELSEDYTCVISHGPNPRTTHIFGNCVIESCCGVGFSANGKESSFLADRQVYPSDDFLSFCYTCKKSLVEGKDIYMYRGEKAFCSSECRYQEMLFDEGMEKCGFFGTEHHHEQKQSG